MEGRALSSDILCRNSEEPECSGGCYPTQAPGTPSTRGWYFSQKTVTLRPAGIAHIFKHYVRALPRLDEVKAGVQV